MASLVIISINEIISLYTYLITSWSIFNTLNNVLIYTKISFYEKIPIGRVINRISNDVREIDDEINYFFYVFLDNFIVCIIYPLVIMYFMPVSLIGTCKNK
jgi:ABC-type multidrug transport system fused ATPase/permease subunit